MLNAIQRLVSYLVIVTLGVVSLFIAAATNKLEEAKYARLKKLQPPLFHNRLLATMVETKAGLESLEKQLAVLRSPSTTSA